MVNSLVQTVRQDIEKDSVNFFEGDFAEMELRSDRIDLDCLPKAFCSRAEIDDVVRASH